MDDGRTKTFALLTLSYWLAKSSSNSSRRTTRKAAAINIIYRVDKKADDWLAGKLCG